MFPIRHFLWIILAFLSAIVFSYFFLDQPIALFFHKAPIFLVPVASFISDIIDPAPNILLWPLIFYLVYFLCKKEALGTKVLLIAISVNASYALTIPIKMFFGRYRPELWFSQNLYGFDFFAFQNRELSFPSGHAATISAIMFALSCLYPQRFIAFMLTGLILSFARVVLDDHYLSDILAGMLVAGIISQFIYVSMKKSNFLDRY